MDFFFIKSAFFKQDEELGHLEILPDIILYAIQYRVCIYIPAQVLYNLLWALLF